MNLSGGQRQRVSIARAIYADAQLYLLDDCLSALDAHVARDVYEKGILGHLRARGKTVLFVTNRMEFVESSDCIVCMDHGRIAAQVSTLLPLLGFAHYVGCIVGLVAWLPET